jgi:hypothetical protein
MFQDFKGGTNTCLNHSEERNVASSVDVSISNDSRQSHYPQNQERHIQAMN